MVDLRLSISFLCAVLGMSSAGTLYMFSLYGNIIAEELQYTQTQINAVAMIGDLGVYVFSPLIGAGVDKWGHRRICLMAAFFLATGYIFMSLTLQKFALSTSFLSMSFYFFLVGVGSSCAYLAAISSQAKNFSSRYRGLALGIPIGAYGLSALVWSQIGRIWFMTGRDGQLDAFKFLWVVGLVLAGINLVNMVGMIRTREQGEDIEDVNERTRLVDDNKYKRSGLEWENEECEEREVVLRVEQDTLIAPNTDIIKPNDQQEFFCNPTTWIFFSGLILICGMGLMYINSVGAIIEALYTDKVTSFPSSKLSVSALTALHVSLLSAFSCIGRVLTGLVSDICERRFKIERVWFFIFAALMMFFAQLACASLVSSSNRALLIITATVGYAYGSTFTVAPAITIDLYGLTHFGRNWGWMSWAPGIGGDTSPITHYLLPNMILNNIIFSCLLGVFAIGAVALPADINNEEGLAPLLQVKEGTKLLPDQYIVVYKENQNVEITDQRVQKGVKHIYNLGGFKGFSGKFDSETLRKIRQNPAVKYVEPDGIATINDIQNGAPWGLARISHRKVDSTTKSQYVYDPKGGEGVTAYVIDTGIYTRHPEFEGRASWGKTFAPDGDSDGNGHGTHVAGTIGSKTYGVAKKVKLIAVKVLDRNGSGSWSNVIAGVNWAADHAKANNPGKSVGNMSLGGGASQSVDDAVNKAVESGLHMAVAAGNDNSDACRYSPARASKVISVAASNSSDRKASFSNYGRCVHVIAPGEGIISTWNNGGTSTISGTSMASPHVAGLVAYFLTVQPRDPISMRNYLKEIATKDAITGYDLVYNNLGAVTA
ncbi:uncharacterized protein VTP21DRAFT_3676 [Calcarisporiella thermophila]|uniref:uncharacterized protein n=1 Tax=Calcarisporiella thermophila TaxID=911321 RepID=UPI0037442E9D